MVLNQILPEVTTWDDVQRAALRCETYLYKTQMSIGILELPNFTSSNIDTLAATALQQQQKQIEELQSKLNKINFLGEVQIYLRMTPSITWDPIKSEDSHKVTRPTLPFVGPTTHQHLPEPNSTLSLPKQRAKISKL
jgi:hypothetical protein